MKTNQKLFILVILGLILVNLDYKIEKQTVAPECFTVEDCSLPVKPGYCDVVYDCIVGRCYHEDIRCKEDCVNNLDDDMDGFVDCKDSDCFNSVRCPCSMMGFTTCYKGRCYCPESETPLWRVYDDGSNECRCS